MKLLKRVPMIVNLYPDRPAVIPEINYAVKGLLSSDGASDSALLDNMFGTAKPEGKLPFELPSSVVAVRKQKKMSNTTRTPY